MLIIGSSGSGKTNALLNLINNQPDIEKIYLYAKDPHENKYQFLIKKRESTGIELQQIAISHSSDIDFKDFVNIYKKCTDKPYSFLVNDTTLASDNPLRFRKNLYNI